MDIFLHFFVSLGLTTVFLLILSNRSMSNHQRASRFWASGDRVRSMIFTTAITLSVVGALGFGVIKEWIDGLGYGNVQLTDFLANLAGIWTGTYLVLHRIRKESTRRRTVRYSSTSVNKNKNAQEYLKLKMLQARNLPGDHKQTESQDKPSHHS